MTTPVPDDFKPVKRYPQARILVIDDNEANVRVIEGMLAKEGWRNVRRVLDSRRALGMFREFAPDLVLLDLLMPNVDGYQVLDEMHEEMKDPTAWPVPASILIVTADTTARKRCWDMGEGNFLPKPIDDIHDFWGRVGTLIEMRMLGLALHRMRGSRG